MNPHRLRHLGLRAILSLLIFSTAALLRATSASPTPTPQPTPILTTASPVVPGTDPTEQSVVKIFTTVSYPDIFKPWTKYSPSEQSGSGVVIEGHRILTNAHVVLYARDVQIQANQSGEKIGATVEAIAPGIDLAVLKLDDEKFFDTHPPLPRDSTLPSIKDPVWVYGYPEGGDSLSITKGIVSRIEFTSYNYDTSGLRIQIDAAINPGNSGGPAVANDKMIGMAFSHLRNAENIGYIIPCEEIDLFLKSLAKDGVSGKPGIYDGFQTLDNPALRSFLKLAPGATGLVVSRPFSNDPSYPLRKWDVITKIGDVSVDDQGMVNLPGNLRVNFGYLLQKIAKDGFVPLAIIRNAKESTIQMPVSMKRPRVMPAMEGKSPSYFIYGPVVFSVATVDYFKSYTEGNSATRWLTVLIVDGNPMIARLEDAPAFPDEQIVIISSPFFPSKLVEGYSRPLGQVVKSINGIKVKNLGHLVAILRDCQDDYVTIDFAGRFDESIVLRRADIAAATEDILTDNGVRSQGSPDMLKIWNAKPAK